MKKIKIVTDSSCDLPRELIEKYSIEIVPLHVVMDGVDVNLTRDEILKGISEGKNIKSSQVTPQGFKEVYPKILKEYDNIISVHLSSKISGTYGSAMVAAKEFGDKIEVVDSFSSSSALGAMVIKAAEMVEMTDDTKKIAEDLRKLSKENLKTIFGIKVMDNLVKGGRISSFAEKISNLINAKPVLRGIDGEIKFYKMTLGFRRVLNEIVNFINSNEIMDNRVFIAHVHADDDVKYIREHVKVHVYSCESGPIIAIHGGIGFVLVGFITAL
ncbi:MAG: DegV family protein [Athalassotoga sp.]|uniref:DegV family protein n=1 Tax=Athalassotoga sp. TaxID=2022597 RepID=UPI003D0930DB